MEVEAERRHGKPFDRGPRRNERIVRPFRGLRKVPT
jgi:hypothetical protein